GGGSCARIVLGCGLGASLWLLSLRLRSIAMNDRRESASNRRRAASPREPACDFSNTNPCRIDGTSTLGFIARGRRSSPIRPPSSLKSHGPSRRRAPEARRRGHVGLNRRAFLGGVS